MTTLSFALVWSLVAVSLVVLTGWGGNISLGHFGIVGIGAMVAGNLLSRWNVDLFVAMVVAMAAGALVAIAIGLPALRIRGFYLAVTTIAFAVALDSYFLNPVNFSSFVPDRRSRRCCSSGSTCRASGCATTSASRSSSSRRWWCGRCAGAAGPRDDRHPRQRAGRRRHGHPHHLGEAADVRVRRHARRPGRRALRSC